MPRYRFTEFVVSPQRRLLLRHGRELPIIPRYFDLLVFLIEHRNEAVHRREIFDRVWTDVIVSDSALSQAIRTLRRTLGDDTREPRFIRTVSRHGYQFVCSDVIEEPDDDGWRTAERPNGESSVSMEPATDRFEPLLSRLTRAPASLADEEEQREAAELLHALGTSEALQRLGTREGHERARALLRDTRWDSSTSGEVPLTGAATFGVVRALVALRLRRAARMVTRRWAGAAAASGMAGLIAGGVGGLMLAAAPDSRSPFSVVPVLAVIGAACGAIGGAGVGAGLSIAEAVARSQRKLALVFGGAAGGGLVGLCVELVARWGLAALVGLDIDVGGGVEGLTIGAAAGIGYAVTTRTDGGGLAAPRGPRRLRAALTTGVLCGLGALVLTLAGRPLVGGTLHAIARAAHSSQVTLAPLGRLIGEPDFGPLTQAVIGFGEGALFGLALTLGLTRRP